MSTTATEMLSRWKGQVDFTQAVQAAPPKKESGIDLDAYKNLLRRSQALRAEGQADSGFAFMVPTEGLKATESRFRQAAKQLAIGCAIEIGEDDGTGQVRMVVEARNMKQVKPLTDAQKAQRTEKRRATLAAKKAAKAAAAKKAAK